MAASDGERTNMSAERRFKVVRLDAALGGGAVMAGADKGAGAGDSACPVSSRLRMVVLLVSSSSCFAANSLSKSAHICGGITSITILE